MSIENIKAAFAAFHHEQINKSAEILSSIKAIHGDLLYDRAAAMHAIVELNGQVIVLLDILMRLLASEEQLSFEVFAPIAIAAHVASEKLAASPIRTAAHVFTDEEYETVQPFLQQAANNTNAVINNFYDRIGARND